MPCYSGFQPPELQETDTIEFQSEIFHWFLSEPQHTNSFFSIVCRGQGSSFYDCHCKSVQVIIPTLRSLQRKVLGESTLSVMQMACVDDCFMEIQLKPGAQEYFELLTRVLEEGRRLREYAILPLLERKEMTLSGVARQFYRNHAVECMLEFVDTFTLIHGYLGFKFECRHSCMVERMTFHCLIFWIQLISMAVYQWLSSE